MFAFCLFLHFTGIVSYCWCDFLSEFCCSLPFLVLLISVLKDCILTLDVFCCSDTGIATFQLKYWTLTLMVCGPWNISTLRVLNTQNKTLTGQFYQRCKSSSYRQIFAFLGGLQIFKIRFSAFFFIPSPPKSPVCAGATIASVGTASVNSRWHLGLLVWLLPFLVRVQRCHIKALLPFRVRVQKCHIKALLPFLVRVQKCHIKALLPFRVRVRKCHIKALLPFLVRVQKCHIKAHALCCIFVPHSKSYALSHAMDFCATERHDWKEWWMIGGGNNSKKGKVGVQFGEHIQKIDKKGRAFCAVLQQGY